MKILNLIVMGIFTSCASPYLQTVSHIDRDRFMGTWYVMAGRFTAVEKDVYNSVEIYTWNEAKQRIDIDFSYNKGALDGPLKKIPQKAWIINQETNATWKVSPFWPLKFTYLVLALDEVKNWTAIGVPGQGYLWIMARDPSFDRASIDAALKAVAEKGYDTRDIVYVEHSKKK